MGSIVVVGGVNMDLHLFEVERSSGQAPMLAQHYLAQPGGKGANVARAVARLGAEVALVARVGDDEFGRDCLRAVSDDGVDTTGVSTGAGQSTGFVAIELVEGRHRSLIFAPGANDALAWADIEPSVAGLGEGDIIIAQAEVPAPALARLADFVVESGAALYLDPAPPEGVNHRLLAAAEVLTPDRLEASQLVGRCDTSSLWPQLAADELLALGARRVIIKTGGTGALLASDDVSMQVPTLTVEVGDETGAGDAFVAALAVARSEGRDWAPATRFANVASALSVASTGLMLPDRAAVDEALAATDQLNDVGADRYAP
ncbi:MAG: PfkB family carbohydrate kinase [Acidimicrobiales bacterium]